MGGRNLRALLAHAVAAAGSGLAGVPDRELLRRYRHERDEPAFAELVRRHARLVWAACRQQLSSDADAEDAFQATFLALARNPGAVRDGGRLAPFLHGVAVRVCSNARRSAARRKLREQIAGRVGPGPAVPDLAWDAALAAVHAEAARLPEALRVPFVLCCLEGKGATEAADLLGWKLGTLSGRLTRAKQTLLSRLEARGLSAGAVVAATAAGVPAGAVARAVEITRPGVAVADAVITLSQGVVGMTAFRIKLIAAAVLVAGGLTTSVGSGWLATADAQTPKPVVPVMLGANVNSNAGVSPPKLWEYRYDTFAPADARPLSREFETRLEEAEAAGWQFVGEVNLRVGTAEKWEGGPTLVFRRPADPAEVKRSLGLRRQDSRPGITGATGQPSPAGDRAVRDTEVAKNMQKMLAATSDPYEVLRLLAKTSALLNDDPEGRAEFADVVRVVSERVRRPADSAVKQYEERLRHAREMELASLRQQLAKMQEAAREPQRRTFTEAELPLSPAEVSDIITRLAAKKYGHDRNKVGMSWTDKSLTVVGDREVVDWAVGIVKKLSEK